MVSHCYTAYIGCAPTNRNSLSMMIYTHQRSKRKKNNSKKYLQAKKEHELFLLSLGVSKSRRRKYVTEFPDLSVESRCTAKVSNQIPGYGFKRTVDDYKWRAGREEKPETIQATENKKKRLAPAYNKGPVMYITDEADKISLGRKV